MKLHHSLIQLQWVTATIFVKVSDIVQRGRKSIHGVLNRFGLKQKGRQICLWMFSPTKSLIHLKILPGLMADTGMIRWPINFPPSSKAAILREARVGRITWQRDLVNSSLMRPPTDHQHHRNHHGSLCLTFLNTIGSSSHTGLMALLFWEVLVFSAFLLVSAGSPNISTSTYTPTRRSVRNWPEITWHG